MLGSYIETLSTGWAALLITHVQIHHLWPRLTAKTGPQAVVASLVLSAH